MKITELDNAPAPESLNALFEQISAMELPEELDTEQLLRLTLWLWNGNGTAKDSDEVWNEYLKENEAYFGEHDTPADFAEYWFNYYADLEISDELVVDWEATYNKELQYDFHEYAIRYDLDNDGFAEHHRYFWRSY